MEQFFTFHQTTIGHRHIKEHTLCEDASFSLTDTENGFAMAAAADGHGSAIYCRSRFGSAFAVQAAQAVFTDFARKCADQPETRSELFRDAETTRQTARQITDAILRHWHAAVKQHLSEHPVQDEELETMPRKFAMLFKNGEDTATMYGTTLIAALRLEDYLILVQQGDGRCVVFYRDGSLNQPIPWDPLCIGTLTTSLCEDNAEEHFRSHVISLKEEPVSAVFLGTDGVEDSFRSMDDMHIFYMKLLRYLQVHPEMFNDELAMLLPKLTRSGSQDDISVSGIVSMNDLPALLDKFRKYISKFNRKDQEDKHKKKIDMMRPVHDHLKTDLHHCELAVLEKTAAKLGKGTPLTREALEAVIRKADPRLTETCFDCIEARINFEGYHKRYLEVLAQGQKPEEQQK